MSNDNIKLIGDELWFQGQKVGTLHSEGVPPSIFAAVRLHVEKNLTVAPVQKWRF